MEKKRETWSGIISKAIENVVTQKELTSNKPGNWHTRVKEICDWLKEQPERTGYAVQDERSIFYHVAPLKFADLIDRYCQTRNAELEERNKRVMALLEEEFRFNMSGVYTKAEINEKWDQFIIQNKLTDGTTNG